MYRPRTRSTLFRYTTLFRSRELDPQHQRVDEEPDQALDLAPVAPGDRRADDDVVLAGVAREQRDERRQQGHELGRAVRRAARARSEEHTSELQSRGHLVRRL